MKKALIIPVLLALVLSVPANAQVGKFLKNVKNSVAKDLLGNPDSNNQKAAPEPSCACDNPDVVLELGKYKIEYTELSIFMLDDGRILLQDKMTQDYYVSRNGAVEGPFKQSDPRVKQFELLMSDSPSKETLLTRYKDYISMKDDKYLITFDGKTYGPYARIDRFAVTLSKEKFAAVVTESVVVTEDEGKKMDAAVKNAKTQEEQMELAMQYSQQLQQKMMNAGGPGSIMPKLVTNVANAKIEQFSAIGSQFFGTIKYDEILLVSLDKVMNLQGNLLLTIKPGSCTPDHLFVSTDNSRYACYGYGTLTFNDGKTMSDLFNPHLVKIDGKVYLEYFYFSPKRNAIVKCRLPF